MQLQNLRALSSFLAKEKPYFIFLEFSQLLFPITLRFAFLLNKIASSTSRFFCIYKIKKMQRKINTIQIFIKFVIICYSLV